MTRRLLALLSLSIPACDADATAKDEPEALATGDGKFDGGGWTEHGAIGFDDGAATAVLGKSTPFHRWTFELSAAAELDLRTKANGDGAVDTVVYLFQQQGDAWVQVGVDDDSGYGALSRLRGSYDAGSYAVVVSGYRRSTKGRFGLTAGCTGAGCEPAAPEPDASCLLGGTLPELFANAGYPAVEFTLVLPDTTVVPERAAQVQEAGRIVFGESLDVAEVLERVDGQQIRRTVVQRMVSGAHYSILELVVGDHTRGVVFRGDTTTVVAEIDDSIFTGCTLVRAPGGNQLGEDCNAQVACGEGLQCTGIAEQTGNGKCVLADSLQGEGDACTSDQACPSDELLCSGLGHDPQAGLCLPVWMRGVLRDENVTAVPAGATQSLTQIAHGLATVAMEIEVFAEINHPRVSSMRVVLTNPSGTEAVVFDGAAQLAENPALDDDGFVEISQLVVGIPGDESVNGAWTLAVTNTDASDAGELVGWSVTLSSRWD
jgi:subtilisin-like proprotein convertase family protein